MEVVILTKVLGHAKSQSMGPWTFRLASPCTFAKTTTPIYISLYCSTANICSEIWDAVYQVNLFNFKGVEFR